MRVALGPEGQVRKGSARVIVFDRQCIQYACHFAASLSTALGIPHDWQ